MCMGLESDDALPVVPGSDGRLPRAPGTQVPLLANSAQHGVVRCSAWAGHNRGPRLAGVRGRAPDVQKCLSEWALLQLEGTPRSAEEHLLEWP